MVGSWRLERQTSPACRGALALGLRLNQLLDQAMRFPALHLAFTTPGLGQLGILFLIDQLPGTPIPRGRAVAAGMLGQAALQVAGGADVEAATRPAPQHVNESH